MAPPTEPRTAASVLVCCDSLIETTLPAPDGTLCGVVAQPAASRSVVSASARDLMADLIPAGR